jgi:hypothetical protein
MGFAFANSAAKITQKENEMLKRGDIVRITKENSSHNGWTARIEKDEPTKNGAYLVYYGAVESGRPFGYYFPENLELVND